MAVIATEPLAFFVGASLGVYISLLPQLLVSKVCSSFYNETICKKLSTGNYKLEEKRVYDEAAKWNIICFAAMTIPSLVTTMIFGALSNVVSKKKLLLVPPVLLSIQTILLIIYSEFVSSNFIFVALTASLTSVYGDFQGHLMLSFSYIADVTDGDETRTLRMTVLGAAVFLGIGLSSFAVGALLQNYGFVVAFSFRLAANVANFMFVAFLLPDVIILKESSTETKSFKDKLSNFGKHFKRSFLDIFKFFKKYLFSWKNKHVSLLLFSSFFTNSALIGERVMLVLFLKHRPLALSADQIGEFLLALQCMSGFGAIILVAVSAKLFKPSDESVITVGQISIISTYLAIGLSKDLHTLFGVTVLAMAFPLPMCGIRSMITKLVEPKEYSTALSCIGFVVILSWLVITFACNEVFRLTATYFPGMSIILLSIMSFTGLVIAGVAFYNDPRNSDDLETSDILLESVSKNDSYQSCDSG